MAVAQIRDRHETSSVLALQGVALAAYAAWIIWVGLHHEPWFDEMQAWLLARDNTFSTLIGYYARYEGTPALWHVLLWCASHAGMPFADIWMLSAVIAFGGAVVTVRYAPFPLPLRLGLLACYYFGYQYSVIARGYCFDLLLVPIAAALFARRVERPLGYALVVGLIANINAYSFIAAGLMGLELLVRLIQARRLIRPQTDAKPWAALALAGALGLFAMWTAWQPHDNGFMDQAEKFNPVSSAMVFIVNGLFDRLTPWSTGHASGLDVLLGLALSFVMLGLVARLVLAGRDRALMLTLPVVLIVFSGAVWSSRWHGGLLFTFVLFVLWTQWHNPVSARSRRILITALALLEISQGLQTLNSGLEDVARTYSAGRAAATGVMAWRAAHPGQAVTAYGGQTFETQPYLPANVFANYYGGAAHPQFVRWNKSDTWHALPHPHEWTDLLDRKPGAVLASYVWLPKPIQPDPARAVCSHGYVLAQTFGASMIWRGIPENNTLFLFERAPSGPCQRG